MLGVCLVTLPGKTNANAADNDNLHTVDTTTEMIDGHEYAVMNIYADTDKETVTAHGDNNPYAKFVLQEDYKYAAVFNLASNAQWWREKNYEAHLILDLHGYTLTAPTVQFSETYVELWDSVGTGKITGTVAVVGYNQAVFVMRGGTIEGSARITNTINSNSLPVEQMPPTGSLTMYGGKITGHVTLNRAGGESNTFDLNFQGGEIAEGIIFGVDGVQVNSITVAPWVEVTNDQSTGLPTSIKANADYVQDGVTYHTIYLRGNSDPEQSMVLYKGSRTENYRYVLMDDWDLVANQVAVATIYANALIFDLNGHKVTSQNGSHYLRFGATTTELTDSAPQGGMTAVNPIALGDNCLTVVFSGNINAILSLSSTVDKEIIVHSAKYIRLRNNSTNQYTWTITAPFLTTWESGGYVYVQPTSDAFAVSDSTIITGAYNYEMGRVWDLTVGELSKLTIPTDKTYYLWGRNADGAYEYLNIQSVDGVWAKTV